MPNELTQSSKPEVLTTKSVDLLLSEGIPAAFLLAEFDDPKSCCSGRLSTKAIEKISIVGINVTYLDGVAGTLRVFCIDYQCFFLLSRKMLKNFPKKAKLGF